MKNIYAIITFIAVATILPTYVTFTHFGEIKFGEYYSGATSMCIVLGAVLAVAVIIHNKSK